MIVSVEELKMQVDCGTATDEQIIAKLKAIEAVIRRYTNNNFQVRGVRFAGYSQGMFVYGSPQGFSVGDVVQVSASNVNDGLYTVMGVQQDGLLLNEYLLDAEYNLVTKVKYPADVIQCAIDLYKWKQNMGDKVGIKSESISRHSVTYEDSSNLFMGYPVAILKGLSLCGKARF